MIKICIIHYNTPLLTECLIKSINKFTPNSEIYIFDNSDKEPFTYRQENIVYFDNTKGQYINFKEWFEKYPNRDKSPGKYNQWGSAKHAVSIQKCIDLINDNFILLDSDVLLQRDISIFNNDKFIYVGQSIQQPKSTISRVLPFILFLNVKLMKEKGVKFFDEKRIHGLYYSPTGDKYDTGASFYDDTKNFPSLEVDIQKYIKHYKGGSWETKHNQRYSITLTSQQWLKQNRKFWDINMDNKKVIYTCITGNYDSLMPQPYIEGYDYICFSDCAIPNSVWEVMPMPDCVKHLSAVKQQRWVKLHPHELLKEYDYSIWVDANVNVLKDPAPLIDDKYSVEIPAHPSRNCIYEEKNACLRIKKDKEEIMEPQMARYRAEGYPKRNGLVQTNIMFRKHNEEDCIRLMETWWAEIEKGSHRDQLSFNYALWKNKGTRFKYMDKKTCESVYFKWLKRHGVLLKCKAALDKPIAVMPIVNDAPKKPAISVKPIYKWVKKNNNKNDELKTFLSQY